MYRYVIYFMIIICLLVIDKIKPSYTIDIITYMLLILLYMGTDAPLGVIAITFIAIAIKSIINIIRKKEFKPAIGAIFSIVSVCILIVQNFITV